MPPIFPPASHVPAAGFAPLWLVRVVRHLRADTCIDHEGDLLANPTAPEPRPFTLWTGRVLLHWARLLQRTVASRDRREALVARRNAAMRAAYERGVDRETIARTIGLSQARVGQALRGEPTVE
jgi:hypothetical protein